MLAALAGHALAFGAAYVAANLTTPSAGGGFEDLAAAVGVLVFGEIMVGLVCVIAGIVLIARGRRDLGLGLAGGWALGLAAGWALVVAA